MAPYAAVAIAAERVVVVGDVGNFVVPVKTDRLYGSLADGIAVEAVAVVVVENSVSCVAVVALRQAEVPSAVDRMPLNVVASMTVELMMVLMWVELSSFHPNAGEFDRWSNEAEAYGLEATVGPSQNHSAASYASYAVEEHL